MLKIYQEPFIQEITEPWMLDKGLRLFIKREDLIHPSVSGNKWRKLKYNLEEAKKQGKSTILTFGGAYSNHIYATAAAAKEAGLQSIGVIRGEELADKPLNPTLTFARDKGMELYFVERSAYRQKHDEAFVERLREQFGDFYLVPEGGTNKLAIKGSAEIVNDEVKKFDVIALAVGTGGTISGIINAAAPNQQVIGISSLKGDFLKIEVQHLLKDYCGKTFDNWQIATDYHFGGYAKVTDKLLDFIKTFQARHQIPLDPIYTGKMMFGIHDIMQKGKFAKGTKILTIHTGGLQGARSWETN